MTKSAGEHMQELAEEEVLCAYCLYTDYGAVSVNTSPLNLCEGRGCESAYERYLEEHPIEEEESPMLLAEILEDAREYFKAAEVMRTKHGLINWDVPEHPMHIPADRFLSMCQQLECGYTVKGRGGINEVNPVYPIELHVHFEEVWFHCVLSVEEAITAGLFSNEEQIEQWRQDYLRKPQEPEPLPF